MLTQCKLNRTLNDWPLVCFDAINHDLLSHVMALTLLVIFEGVDEMRKSLLPFTTEKCFPMVLFIMLCKLVLTFQSVVKSSRVAIQMKATQQCFLVVPFIRL